MIAIDLVRRFARTAWVRSGARRAIHGGGVARAWRTPRTGQPPCSPNREDVPAKRTSPISELNRTAAKLLADRNVAGAIALVRDSLVKEDIFSEQACSVVLFLCEQEGRESEALELIRLILSSRPHMEWRDESLVSVVLRILCASGDEGGARRNFAYLLEKGMVRRRSASTYLRFCCAQKDYSTAAAVFGEAAKRSIELGAEEYDALFRLCLGFGEPACTLHWLLQGMAEHVTALPNDTVDAALLPWAASGALRWAKVDVDSATGVCPCCGGQLRGFPFTASYKRQLLRDLDEVVVPQKCRSSKAKAAFAVWRRFVAANRYDVLIDGANLGYYGLSSWYSLAKRAMLIKRGMPVEAILPADVAWSPKQKSVDVSVNFSLIDMAVQDIVRRGLRPLVVLHERHLEQRNIAPHDEVVAERWRAAGQVYATPSGLNDDLCWLYGAVSWTEPSDWGASADVKGRRTLVLTNDKMRDHHFQLLSQKSFTRWRDRHRIGFKCKREGGETKVLLEFPPLFSICIQSGGPERWHIPISAPLGAPAPSRPSQQADLAFLAQCADDDGNEAADASCNEGEATAEGVPTLWLCLRPS